MKLTGKQIAKSSLTSDNLSEFSLTNKNNLGYFLENNYIYIINNTVLTVISSKAI
jgi:hypothetical protein